MVKAIWSKEEIDLLKKAYPSCENIKEIIHLFNDKTYNQIRSKTGSLGLKKYKESRVLEDLHLNDTLCCRTCKSDFSPFGDNAHIIKRKLNEGHVVSIDCKECNRRRKVAQYYLYKYGIEMDAHLLYDTFDIFQWYRWSVIEKTPKGTLIDSLPYSLQTDENIERIIKYSISDILNLKTKEDILSLTVKQMNEYKIAFTGNPLISNSPIKAIRLAYPDLEFSENEMVSTNRGFWHIYENFLSVVTTYYKSEKEVLSSLGIDYIFTNNYLYEKNSKLLAIKKSLYKHKTWYEILKDASIDFQMNLQKYSLDGERFDSHQEKIVYELLRSIPNTTVVNNRLGKSSVKVFKDIDGSYVPDFIVYSANNKPVIIEYFGMYNENSTSEVFVNYRSKTKKKIEFFKNLDDYLFIPLFEGDLSNNFKGIKYKISQVINICA